MQRAAKSAASEEACGLLFGTSEAITGCEIAPNVAEDPARHFEIDPVALFAALRAERAGGAKLIGYWHSHPSGDAMPSVTDAAMAAPDGKIWLILAGDTLSAWRAGGEGLHGRFSEIVLEIGD